ncbi:NADH-quinone oxidoreductase subunit NuoE [Oscillibacter sp.]|uniref:NADH-quinone oxidoreductase subunit NuoE n=1 Tax=Oscillibacter sp. TaxID=1945593 RepID=UPI0026187C9C|nr:NADH-quinone oxidoreductase subunit NuoE [Oscillibacter sp.]MDD3347623.1 NADH-quinone oxidoreductase subunit NuoE [Oscillibacter sp.]
MPQIEELVRNIVSKTGADRENLLPILQEVTRHERYLSEEALTQIAKAMDISCAEVYGVASFYTFLDTVPRGQNIIRICKTISCYMAGKDKIVRAIEKKLRIKLGETTPDNRFTFLATNCIGWCHKGPAMLINDKVYTELTAEKAVAALEEYL